MGALYFAFNPPVSVSSEPVRCHQTALPVIPRKPLEACGILPEELSSRVDGEQLPPSDDDGVHALVVLGGGPTNATGHLPPWSQERCVAVAALWRCLKWRGREVMVLAASGGTPHMPHARNQDGSVEHESVAMSRCLVAEGVEPNLIRAEWQSMDTIGNAAFIRSLLAEPMGLRSLMVITSDWHMPRAEAIFRWVGSLPSASSGCRLQTFFHPVVGAPLPATLASVHSEREAKKIDEIHRLEQRVRTMPQLWDFLYQEHQCYTTGKIPEKAQGLEMGVYDPTTWHGRSAR